MFDHEKSCDRKEEFSSQNGTFAMRAGAFRRKHKIQPPCMDGPDEFLRANRAQQNCLEFFPPFILCLWTAGLFFHQIPAAILGVTYMYGRQSYFNGYIVHAQQRLPGFYLSSKVLRAYLVLILLGIGQVLLLSYLGIDVKSVLVKYVKGFIEY